MGLVTTVISLLRAHLWGHRYRHRCRYRYYYSHSTIARLRFALPHPARLPNPPLRVGAQVGIQVSFAGGCFAIWSTMGLSMGIPVPHRLSMHHDRAGGTVLTQPVTRSVPRKGLPWKLDFVQRLAAAHHHPI
ncbi:hypothetical protein CMUS01_02667 [Colletotrichum musicola]|uniref:Uncharacterized protein n=1 Tax=Colletotrichum musicola TaxID=2175873 RepID=A0A8H6U7L4_9PEZI|nr:hypothetical protein CMUS01_02667 [Colletotrichum musicola]